MGSPQAAGYPVAAMDETSRARKKPDATRHKEGACMDKCQQWPGTMVECQNLTHARSPTECLLHQNRADLVPEGTPTPILRFMNRRIRNRTYGGVGGGPKMPSYPIFCQAASFCEKYRNEKGLSAPSSFHFVLFSAGWRRSAGCGCRLLREARPTLHRKYGSLVQDRKPNRERRRRLLLPAVR